MTCSHKRARLVVKRGAAHVHVVRGLLAGGQRKVPALDGQRADQFNESPAKRIVHGLKCSGAELVNFKLVLSSFDESIIQVSWLHINSRDIILKETTYENPQRYNF